MPASAIAAHRFRPLLIAALLLPLMAMLVFAGVLLWQVQRVNENQWWVEHTDEVIARASELHANHLRAESALRGFLITQQQELRTAFESEKSSIESRSEALALLVRDNPSQVERVHQIRQMRLLWLQIVDEEARLRDTGGDWESLVKAGVARVTMQHINDAFTEFIGVEQGLRDQRIARVRHSSGMTLWIAGLLALVLGAILAAIAWRQLGYLSATYSEALEDANDAASVLEKRVAARTRELASANEAMKIAAVALRVSNERLKISNSELQDFASVASHDLQEPLRKVQAFGDRLKAKAGDTLGPEMTDYLDRMLNAAGRMKSLINDLLTFARVTSRAQPFGPVDLKLVTQQVLSDLESRIEETKAIVDVGELPIIDADVTQMRQLIQNLIGNALKFSKPGNPPRVQVNAVMKTQANGERWMTMRVRDNGIGFDEKYLDRIFTVFQRLHGRSEYEGTGIGLAVCRKIVERHRGQLTGESRPGEGATFIVNLPMMQPNLPLVAHEKIDAVEMAITGRHIDEPLDESASAA